MKKVNWRVMRETWLALYPFFAGAVIAFDWLSRRMVEFWIMLGVSAVLAVTLVRTNYQRDKAIQLLTELKDVLKDSGEAQQRLLIDNVRVHAILAALLGLKMQVKVTVKKVGE